MVLVGLFGQGWRVVSHLSILVVLLLVIGSLGSGLLMSNRVNTGYVPDYVKRHLGIDNPARMNLAPFVLPTIGVDGWELVNLYHAESSVGSDQLVDLIVVPHNVELRVLSYYIICDSGDGNMDFLGVAPVLADVNKEVIRRRYRDGVTWSPGRS